LRHLGREAEHPVLVAGRRHELLDLPLQLDVASGHHRRPERRAHMHRLPHHREGVVAPRRTCRDQQAGHVIRITLEVCLRMRRDRDADRSHPIGRNPLRGQLHAPLLARKEQRVERTRQPQPVEVVVGGDDRRLGIGRAAQHEGCHQLGRQEVRAHDGGRLEPLDLADRRHRVGPRPRVDRPPPPERQIADVVPPVDQPRRIVDQHEVPLAQQIAVEGAALLQHVDDEDLFDVGAG